MVSQIMFRAIDPVDKIELSAENTTCLLICHSDTLQILETEFH